MLRYPLRRAFPLLLLSLLCAAPEARAQACATLFSSPATKTTTGTTAEALYTFTIPTLLDSDGDYLEVRYAGRHAANANPTSIWLAVGGSPVSIATATGSGMLYRGEARLYYRDAATLVVSQQHQNGPNRIMPSVTTHAVDLTNTWSLQLFAETPTQAGDVTFDHFLVLSCTF
jgi:hypothetical protein